MTTVVMAQECNGLANGCNSLKRFKEKVADERDRAVAGHRAASKGLAAGIPLGCFKGTGQLTVPHQHPWAGNQPKSGLD
ncbi:MAG: hypothetical protein EBS84_17150 [Proteobacteria bacterium]|nr:hypothetical protein [Verrucomicrobiota bacterium]NBU10721.1 hypothetical protein [Pseudomonadota bacterium]NDE97809.1 hypothetical protein [Verrucomicrobiota bacterium]